MLVGRSHSLREMASLLMAFHAACTLDLGNLPSLLLTRPSAHAEVARSRICSRLGYRAMILHNWCTAFVAAGAAVFLVRGP